VATQFKVQGELTLDGSGFVASAKDAQAALTGVDAASKSLADTSRTLSAATDAATAGLGKQTTTTVQATQATVAADAASRSHSTSIASVAKDANAGQVAIAALKAANDDLGKSAGTAAGKLSDQQKVMLAFHLENTFEQLAAGQTVLRTLAIQVPQMASTFTSSLVPALTRIPVPAIAAAAAVALVGSAIIGAIVHGNELTAMNRQIEISLQATGRAANLTATQLQNVILAEAAKPGAGRDVTQQAALQLLSNNAIGGANLQQTLSLARDLSRITGQDLPAAAQALSQGLDGTVAGAQKLDAIFNALTPAELEQVRRLQDMGDKGGAVSVVLAAIQRNAGGANSAGITPLAQGFNDLSVSLGKVQDKVSNDRVWQLLTKGAGIFMTRAANGFGFFGGTGDEHQTPSQLQDGPTPQELAALRQQLDQARQELSTAQAVAARYKGQPATDPNAAMAFGNVNSAAAKVRDLQANLDYQEQRANKIAAQAATNAATTATTKTNEIGKQADSVINKVQTIVGQFNSLQAEAAQIRAGLATGLLDPDQTAKAQERLQQIQGQLLSMKTPAVELAQTLANQSLLAGMKPIDRSATEAYLNTFKQALAVTGDLTKAEQLAGQARDNVLKQQATSTSQQIEQLGEEAQAALKVANAYDVSRASAIQLAAQLKAQQAERAQQIAPGTAGAVAQETLEQGGAAAVQAAADKNAGYALQIRQLKVLADAEAVGAAQTREATRQNQVAAMAEELRAQAAATGSAVIIAAAEKQIAIYDELSKKELAVNVQRDAQALNRQYDPSAQYDYEISRLNELKATGLLTARTIQDAWKEAELKKLEASREATDGMIGALKRYADEATNAGAAAADGVNSGLKTIEDTLVQVVTTGKVQFSDLANSILADFARVAIRQTITGPLAGAFGDILKNIFSPGGGGGAAAPHTGGLVGNLGQTRGVDPMIYAVAPRFHGGGIPGLGPDEVPAVLTENEEVITSSDPRHRWNMARNSSGGTYGAPSFDVQVVNNGQPVNARKGPVTSNGQGGFRMQLILDPVRQAIARDIANQDGVVYSAMASTFGAKPAPRGT